MRAAEDLLAAREVLGWRLGLDRMRRICSLLDDPQRSFESIHVVGTNGKSSTTRLTAAILAQAGRVAGAYTSPHLHEWRERITVGGSPIGRGPFNRAMARAEEAAAEADQSAGDAGPVTQFELMTAAAFCALAEHGVEVAVIEAGLGGRLDATNVIPSRATVLTSVGFDHTDWLGETLTEIATEKLDVLRPGTVLITGELPPEAELVAERLVGERDAKWVRADPWPWPGAPRFQRLNLGMAAAAAAIVDGPVGEETVDGAREAVTLIGRFQLVGGDPLAVVDVAHNPPAAQALAAAVSDLAEGRPVTCCLALLADKDAEGIVEPLVEVCERFVCTEIPASAIEGSGRPAVDSCRAGNLVRLCSDSGREAESVRDPAAAWRRAREIAAAESGVALATGSHYLLTCIDG